MALKYKNPLTPGQRGQVSVDLSQLGIPKENREHWKKILKALSKGKIEKAGRNHHGHITVWHRGGGHKRKYKKVLFQRHLLQKTILQMYNGLHPLVPMEDIDGLQLKAEVKALVYDANRNAFLALVTVNLKGWGLWSQGAICLHTQKVGGDKIYLDKEGESLWFYMLAPKGLKVGDQFPLRTQSKDLLQVGEALPVEKVPLGVLVHNMEIHKGKGGQLSRAAGSYGQIIENAEKRKLVRVRMPSGEQRWLVYGSYVSIGSVGNEDATHVVLAKAGRSRWLSKRPSVRGVAMNPVDHPHGGGEGKTSGGRPSVTPWGWPTRNWSPRKKRKNPFLIN